MTDHSSLSDVDFMSTAATVADRSLGEGSSGGAAVSTAVGRTTALPRWVEGAEDDALQVHEPVARYEPVRILGEGTMGEVMLVRDNDIDRHVAMKRLKTERHQEWHVSRFVEEIKTIGQLEHPNIVPIHDVGVTEEGAFFFIMKHIDGDTLDTIIKRLREGDEETHARYPFPVRLALLEDVLEAMDFAHKRGVIHRDLKPANIIVGHHGEVVVMDWGLAKVVDASGDAAADFSDLLAQCGRPGDSAIKARLHETQHNDLVGTPLYMAPEQAMLLHDALDQRTDLYALSVLFYEFLTLVHPLRGKKELIELLEGVVHEEPAKAYMVENPHQGRVPIEYWYFVEKGMAKAPEDRYQSAEEMLVEVRKVSLGSYDVQCILTGAKRAGHTYLEFINNNPMLSGYAILGGAALVALALLVLLAAGVIVVAQAAL